MIKKNYNSRQQEKDKNIIDFVERHNLDFSSAEYDYFLKVKFLKTGMKYKHLRIGANNTGCAYIPIEDCSVYRINAAVKNIYNAAIRRQNEIKLGQLELNI